jgi:general secretion pathway protein A
MYEQHFGLKEEPFSIAPNPRFLYMSARHREALAHLVYGINNYGGFILLTGEVGTGKTTISRCLLEQIPEDANVALIINPKIMAGELLATLCDELHIDYPKDTTSIKTFIDHINKYLLEANARGEKTVVIIEESQNLTTDVLEQLRLLTNLETNQHKLLQIIMIGQPELLETLKQTEIRQLEQRITARYHLLPLSSNESAEYVRHRLSVAGMRDQIFLPSVLKKIYKYTGGVPRRINILCDRAMLGAYVQNVKVIDNKILNNAAKEVFGETNALNQHPKKFFGWIATSVALIIGGAGLAAAYYKADLPMDRSVVSTPLPEIEPYVTTPPIETDEPDQNSMENNHLDLDSKTTSVIPASFSDGLIFLDGQSVRTSRKHAYLSMLEAWDSNLSPDENEEVCDFVSVIGLECLKKNGNFRSLLVLNRPAVLILVNAKGQPLYATLKKLEQEIATVEVNGKPKLIAVKDIESRWFGDYTLLWRKPPDYHGVIMPGSMGESIAWMASKLDMIYGTSLSRTSGISYDRKLVDQVKDFQLNAGLISDGIVGEQTLIHLNTMTEKNVPRLMVKDSENI